MRFPLQQSQLKRGWITIPEIWSNHLQMTYPCETILPYIARTDYDGEIWHKNDTVHFPTVPEIFIQDECEQLIEQPSDTGLILAVDKDEWITEDAHSNDINQMPRIMERMAKKACKTIEPKIFEGVKYNLSTQSEPLQISLSDTGNDTITRKIKDARIALDKQGISAAGRWMWVPYELYRKILDLGLREVDNFVLFTSRFPKDIDNRTILFGHRDALIFAFQFMPLEGPIPDSQGYFYGTQVVYGYKVVKPELMGYMIVKQGCLQI